MRVDVHEESFQGGRFRCHLPILHLVESINV